MKVVEYVFVALLVFLPAGLANAAPVFASRWRWLDKLNVPIDGGRHFRGKRIFGANKTVRGFVAGFGFALVGVLVQRWIDSAVCVSCSGFSNAIASVNIFVLAALYSFGALGGDALESFVKRQLNKPAGSTWVPFDQLDFIIGALLATWPVLHYSGMTVVAVVGVMFVAHIISTFVGFTFGLKDKPI